MSRKPWPIFLPGCPRCLRLSRFVAYSGGHSGLCVDCGVEVTRTGDRVRWVRVFKKIKNLHYNGRRGKNANLALTVVRDFGFPYLIDWLRCPSDDLRAWILGRQPPPLQLLKLAQAVGRQSEIWEIQRNETALTIDAFATLGMGSDSLTEPEYIPGGPSHIGEQTRMPR